MITCKSCGKVFSEKENRCPFCGCEKSQNPDHSSSYYVEDSNKTFIPYQYIPEVDPEDERIKKLEQKLHEHREVQRPKERLILFIILGGAILTLIVLGIMIILNQQALSKLLASPYTSDYKEAIKTEVDTYIVEGIEDEYKKLEQPYQTHPSAYHNDKYIIFNTNTVENVKTPINTVEHYKNQFYVFFDKIYFNGGSVSGRQDQFYYNGSVIIDCTSVTYATRQMYTHSKDGDTVVRRNNFILNGTTFEAYEKYSDAEGFEYKIFSQPKNGEEYCIMITLSSEFALDYHKIFPYFNVVKQPLNR